MYSCFVFLFFIHIFILMSKSDGDIGERFCIEMRCEFQRKKVTRLSSTYCFVFCLSNIHLILTWTLFHIMS